jgi:putative copper export protein
MLALAATTAMIMGTIAGPAIQLIFGGQLLGDIVITQAGAAQLARLTALVAAMATCAWLGGLLALATVLIPGEKMQELDQLIPRFSRVAQLSVVTLIVTGIVHALAGRRWRVSAGWFSLRAGLLIKVSIFGLMLLMGNEGRKYAARAAFRLQHQPPGAPLKAGGISTLAVVMGAELCIAFVILSTTSLLVMVAPHP